MAASPARSPPRRSRTCSPAEGRPLWKTTGTSAIDSSPSLGPDLLFYGAFDRALHAVDLQGHEKWTFETDGPIHSSPAIAADGTVWFGSDDGKLYAVSPEGALLWSTACLKAAGVA